MHQPDLVVPIAPIELERAAEHQRAIYPEDGPALDRLFKYLDLNRPMMAEIMDAVSDFYGQSADTITSDNRSPEPVLARQVFCYLAHRYTRFTMVRIGRFIGNRDHTTILHSVRKIERLVIKKPLLADDLDVLRLRIAEKVLLRAKTRMVGC